MIETRYFQNANINNNALLCKYLALTQTVVAASAACGGNNSCIYGIRVWRRTSVGAENELTGGAYVAQVTRVGAGAGLQSNTWNCPYYVMNLTDSIVVRVYANAGGGGFVLLNTWQTEDLNALFLKSSTWTVYYYTQGVVVGEGFDFYFWYGTVAYNSRIENFQYRHYAESQRMNKLLMSCGL